MNTIHSRQSEQEHLEIEVQAWEQLIEITKNRFFKWEQIWKTENVRDQIWFCEHISMIKKDIFLQIKMLEETKIALTKLKKDKN